MRAGGTPATPPSKSTGFIRNSKCPTARPVRIGTIVTRTPPSSRPTPVLCKAEMLGEAPELTFLCIVPDRYGEMDLEMTSTVKERFPALEALLLEELAARGIRPEKSHA